MTIFSDPMVSVIGEVGNRLSIDAFYISFVVTPLISNASELISSVMFAAKKSPKSMTMTFSALLGAATMNNTFCLAIFMGLVYFKNLTWAFSSQVTAILVVQAAVCVVASFKTQKLWMGFIPLLCYPLSLIIVRYFPQ